MAQAASGAGPSPKDNLELQAHQTETIAHAIEQGRYVNIEKTKAGQQIIHVFGWRISAAWQRLWADSQSTFKTLCSAEEQTKFLMKQEKGLLPSDAPPPAPNTPKHSINAVPAPKTGEAPKTPTLQELAQTVKARCQAIKEQVAKAPAKKAADEMSNKLQPFQKTLSPNATIDETNDLLITLNAHKPNVPVPVENHAKDVVRDNLARMKNDVGEAVTKFQGEAKKAIAANDYGQQMACYRAEMQNDKGAQVAKLAKQGQAVLGDEFTQVGKEVDALNDAREIQLKALRKNMNSAVFKDVNSLRVDIVHYNNTNPLVATLQDLETRAEGFIKSGCTAVEFDAIHAEYQKLKSEATTTLQGMAKAAIEPQLKILKSVPDNATLSEKLKAIRDFQNVLEANKDGIAEDFRIECNREVERLKAQIQPEVNNTVTGQLGALQKADSFEDRLEFAHDVQEAMRIYNGILPEQTMDRCKTALPMIYKQQNEKCKQLMKQTSDTAKLNDRNAQLKGYADIQAKYDQLKREYEEMDKALGTGVDARKELAESMLQAERALIDLRKKIVGSYNADLEKVAKDAKDGSPEKADAQRLIKDLAAFPKSTEPTDQEEEFFQIASNVGFFLESASKKIAAEAKKKEAEAKTKKA